MSNSIRKNQISTIDRYKLIWNIVDVDQLKDMKPKPTHTFSLLLMLYLTLNVQLVYSLIVSINLGHIYQTDINMMSQFSTNVFLFSFLTMFT